MMGYKIGGEDANVRCNWSSIQEPWERDCFYFMVPISSLFFNFV